MKGKEQIISNIEACLAVVEVIRTTLGPRGMDKMIIGDNGTTISNDGATIIKLLSIEHPAAKSLADVAKSQDNEIGDGTTSVMIFAGELLKEAKQFINDGISPQIIINGYWKALQLARKRLEECAITINDKSEDEKRNLLLRCAQTSLNSKLIANYKEFFFKNGRRSCRKIRRL
jgi:T-complex protein 1 subunit eta